MAKTLVKRARRKAHARFESNLKLKRKKRAARQLFQEFGIPEEDLSEMGKMLILQTSTGPVDEEIAESHLKWGQYYLPHYFDTPPSAMHLALDRDFSDLHEKRGQKRLIIAPRGSAKSTHSTLTLPLRSICEETESYILIISDTQSQARAFLSAIKDELEDNEQLARDYPRATGRARRVWSQDRIVTNNGVTVEVLGTGAKIRGRRKRQFRPTLIIIDDMENDDHAFSPILRERTWVWLTKAVLKAGSPRTNVIVLGTIIHRDSALANLQKNPGWKHRFFKSVMQWPDRMDLWEEWEKIYSRPGKSSSRKAFQFYVKNKNRMNAGAVVLWPEREPLYDLMKMRVIEGKISFESEKQNNPVDPDKREWPDEYFSDEVWFEEWPDWRRVTHWVISLDPSKGKDSKVNKAKRGDFQAYADVRRTYDGLMYVEFHMLRLPSEDMVEYGVKLCKQGPPGKLNAFGLEATGYQDLLAPLFEKEAKMQGVDLPLRLLSNVVQKVVRCRRLGKWLAPRLFRFRRTPGTRKAVEQMMDFPNGDHDDGPDTLEMNIRTLIAIINEQVEDN